MFASITEETLLLNDVNLNARRVEIRILPPI